MEDAMGFWSDDSCEYPGLVEYALILVLVAIVVIAALTILAPFFEGVNGSSNASEAAATIHLVCHQGEQKIVDVQTDNGWTFGDINPREPVQLGWKWEVRGVEYTLNKLENTKCEYIPVQP